MKKTEILKEIKAKDIKALTKELNDEQKKLTQLEFNAGFKKVKNVHEVTVSRKRIARIMTILNEKVYEEILKEVK